MATTKTQRGMQRIRSLLAEYRRAREIVSRVSACSPLSGASSDQSRRVTIAAIALAEYLTNGGEP
jgi:hypothetical protein